MTMMTTTTTTTRMRKTAVGMLTGVTAFWCGVTLLSPPAQAVPDYMRSIFSVEEGECTATRPAPLGFPGASLEHQARTTTDGVTLDTIYLQARAVNSYKKLYAATTPGERRRLQERLLTNSPYARARMRVAEARQSKTPQWYEDLQEWRRDTTAIAPPAPDAPGDPNNRQDNKNRFLHSLGVNPLEWYRDHVINEVKLAQQVSEIGGERFGCEHERQIGEHLRGIEEVKDWMRRNHML
jgi:hypothetical protein